jgi:dTMP kinase
VKASIRQGLSQSWLQSLFDTVANPDLVILLDVDPAVSWRRRNRFKASEIGRWDGYTGDTYSAYCEYQGLVRKGLLALALDRKWLVVPQTSDTNEAEVVESVYSQVKCTLRCSS